MKLSVIIPTRMRPALLKAALHSLAGQGLDRSRFEVLVVDNGPSADAAEIAASFARSLTLRYMAEPAPGLHNARHRGLREAAADILVFADDDIEAFQGWLECIEEGFQSEDVVLVGGKNLPRFESPPPGWLRKMWEVPAPAGRYLPFLSLLDLGDQVKEIDPFHVFGCNFSIRKETLLAAGGFHPDAMPQETIRYRGDGESHVCSFIKKRGLKALYHPGASVFHFVPDSRMCLGYFAQRAYNQGVSDSFTAIRSSGKVSLRNRIDSDRMATVASLAGFAFRFRQSPFLLKKVTEASYAAGFNYHHRQAHDDRELLEWVLKENWLTHGQPSSCPGPEPADEAMNRQANAHD